MWLQGFTKCGTIAATLLCFAVAPATAFGQHHAGYHVGHVYGGYRGAYRGGYYGGYRHYGYGGIYRNYYPRYYGSYRYPYSFYGFGYPYYNYGYAYPYYYGYTYPSYYGYSDVYEAPSYYYPSPVYNSGYLDIEPVRNDTARLTVTVPAADAQVWIAGAETRQQGTVRTFITPPLTRNTDFTYDIRAKWQEGGRVFDQTQKVPIQAGSGVIVNFTPRE